MIFVALGHRWKFIYVKNKRVKYSHGLIWVTYGSWLLLLRRLQYNSFHRQIKSYFNNPHTLYL